MAFLLLKRNGNALYRVDRRMCIEKNEILIAHNKKEKGYCLHINTLDEISFRTFTLYIMKYKIIYGYIEYFFPFFH